MIFLNWHLIWGHNSKSMIHRKKLKLAPEREFKTVFLGLTKKTQSGRLQLVCGHWIFWFILSTGSWIICSGIMCTMSLKVFFQSIDNRWFLFPQVNHGIRPEELREVTIWESLDLGFAADNSCETALKNALISAIVWHVALPSISQKTFELFCVYLAKLCSSTYLGLQNI